MSSGRKLDAAEVRPIAESVVERLRHAASRIEIAGSLRRHAAQVSDVEIVCVPWTSAENDLFGAVTGVRCHLAGAVEAGVRMGWLRWRTETHPTPPKDWREPRRVWSLVAMLRSPTAGDTLDVPLDLFAVRPPAQWGAILAIRTGPGDFSRRLVTQCQGRGLRCTGGHLETERGVYVPTPEERDFLRECGSPWIDPEHRR